ncbi:MAG: hypothetical protein KDD06_03300 [Phaeodactylibacter sp.]|nr:hypothetical protein [Phaeodactylibacter sp.]MCB9291203.1 GNAT family N-acetyltransferase [Lewinellaceae bacterium]
MFTYGPSTTDLHLRQIMALQKANLPRNISLQESREQGFVTVDHDMETLRDMNTPYCHSTAWAGVEIAGYALVMETRFGARIPVLVPMFELLDGIPWKGRPLRDWRYFVMGQVCVAKPYRGQGVFQGLYLDMRDRLSADFDLVVTEISARNPRSIRAHEKVGFENIHEYTDPDGEHWVIVAWGWEDKC